MVVKYFGLSKKRERNLKRHLSNVLTSRWLGGVVINTCIQGRSVSFATYPGVALPWSGLTLEWSNPGVAKLFLQGGKNRWGKNPEENNRSS